MHVIERKTYIIASMSIVVAFGLGASSTPQSRPSPDELVQKIRAHYRSLETYHDKGTFKSNFGQMPAEGSFETFFRRKDGFKIDRSEKQAGYLQARYVLWGNEKCLTQYGEHSFDESLRMRQHYHNYSSDCVQPQNAVIKSEVECLVPSLLIETIRCGGSPGGRQVEEGQTPFGQKAYVLVGESQSPRSTVRTWIDPVSYAVMRYEHTAVYRIVPYAVPGIKTPNVDANKTEEIKVLSIDYETIEINPSLSPSSVRFEAPKVSTSQHLIAQAEFLPPIVPPCQDPPHACAQRVWSSFIARLQAGDATGALGHLAPGLQSRFRRIFEELGPNLPSVSEKFGELKISGQSENLAEGVIVRKDGKPGFVYFLRDGQGRWLISEM